MLEGASTLTSQESHGWECSWPLSLSFRQATVFSFVQVLKLSSSLNQIHAHIYLHVFRYVCVCVVVVVVLVTQSCPTLCNPVDWSPPGFSVPGISQARILEWVAISFSRGSSWPRDLLHYRWILCHWATRETHTCVYTHIKDYISW